MTPNSFEFTLTIPGDARLLEVIRALVTQTAGYAQLTTDASRTLVDEVARAAQAMSTPRTDGASLELVFSGDEQAITIKISSDRQPSAERPQSAQVEGVSVEWSVNGSRQICRIRQKMPA
jgi:hypothetical protein